MKSNNIDLSSLSITDLKVIYDHLNEKSSNLRYTINKANVPNFFKQHDWMKVSDEELSSAKNKLKQYEGAMTACWVEIEKRIKDIFHEKI